MVQTIAQEFTILDSSLMPGQSEIGRIIGHYEIERLIAQGGMASVFQARHIDLDRRVALKLFYPPPGRDIGRFRERFLQEARTLAMLHHPNIVAVYDYGVTGDGGFYLALEYIQGSTWYELFKESPFPPQRALPLFRQVCLALSYIHQRGVVHRDIKLLNILIERDEDGGERIKLVDFGLVKLLEADNEFTSVGLVIGSPHFMAPEQIDADAVDHRTDIYAAGVLLYYCLAGSFPFDGTSASAIMSGHLTRSVPPLPSGPACPGATPALDAVMRRCLEKLPAARYGNVQELLADFDAALKSPSPPPGVLPEPLVESQPEPSGSPAGHAYRTLAAMLMLGLIVGLGVFTRYFHGIGPRTPAPHPAATALDGPPRPVRPEGVRLRFEAPDRPAASVTGAGSPGNTPVISSPESGSVPGPLSGKAGQSSEPIQSSLEVMTLPTSQAGKSPGLRPAAVAKRAQPKPQLPRGPGARQHRVAGSQGEAIVPGTTHSAVSSGGSGETTPRSTASEDRNGGRAASDNSWEDETDDLENPWNE